MRIKGRIINVSSPKEFRVDKRPSRYRSNVVDYYHVMVEVNPNKRVTCFLSTNVMGISNIERSIIFYKQNGTWIKTGILNPKKYVGKSVIVDGEMKNEIYMNKLTAFRLLL